MYSKGPNLHMGLVGSETQRKGLLDMFLAPLAIPKEHLLQKFHAGRLEYFIGMLTKKYIYTYVIGTILNMSVICF